MNVARLSIRPDGYEPVCDIGAVEANRLERWEYDTALELIDALVSHDRARFNEVLAARDLDRRELQADLIAVAIRVAEVLRFRYPVWHRRPSPDDRRQVVEALATAEFADLVNRDFAHLILDRLYQRAFRDPIIATIDLISVTTSLLVCSWTLRNRWGVFPRDQDLRWRSAYRGVTAGMRMRRASVPDWIRNPPLVAE